MVDVSTDDQEKEKGCKRFHRWATVSLVNVLALHLVSSTLFNFRHAMIFSSVFLNTKKSDLGPLKHKHCPESFEGKCGPPEHLGYEHCSMFGWLFVSFNIPVSAQG